MRSRTKSGITRSLGVALFVAMIAFSALLIARPGDGNSKGLSTRASLSSVEPGLTKVSQAPTQITPAVTVWTGTEVISFGSTSDQSKNVGVAFRPAEESWRTLPAPPFETTVSGVSGVWTGRVLVVIGVLCGNREDSGSTDEPKCKPGSLVAATYDPSADDWTRLPIPDALRGNSGEPGVNNAGEPIGWTGDRAVFNIGRDFYAIDPVAGEWSVLPSPSERGRVCIADGVLVSVTAIDENGTPVDIGLPGVALKATYFDSDRLAWAGEASVIALNPPSGARPAGIEFACGDRVVAFTPFVMSSLAVLDPTSRMWAIAQAPPSDEARQPLSPDLQKRFSETGTTVLSYLNNVAWTGRGIVLSSGGFQTRVEGPGADGTEVVFPPYAIATDDLGLTWRKVDPGPVAGGAVTWTDGFAFGLRSDDGQTTLWTYKP